jgi:Tol biopolymer transport system component
MKKTFLIAVLAVSVISVGAQNGNDLFQKALILERTEGNLQEAIKLYEQIVQNFASDRKLAAQALLQMGRCYETLGQDGARKAYDQIVSEYADQAEPVKEARSRLAALTAAQPATLTTHKLDNPPADAQRGSPSPDGRYLSFWDWKTGDLAVRDLQTGKDRRLTDEGNEWGAVVPVSQEAGVSAWSPDGKQLAYGWGMWSTDSAESAGELRVVGVDGGNPRVISHYDNADEFDNLEWSPDGKDILAVIPRENGPVQLALISVADGSARILAEFNRRIYPTNICFSPDGSYIAYDALPDEQSPERDIFVMPIASGKATPLIQHPADDYLLGWSRDGKWLVFASDRTGTLGLWVANVSGAKIQEEPQLVKPDIGPILPMGLTHEGELYYSKRIGGTDIYLADLDPQTGKVAGLPRKMIKQYEGKNSQPSFSPDGKYLAYVSERGFGGLRIRSLDTGQERVLNQEISKLGLQSSDGPRWSPDGRQLTFYSSNDNSTHGLYLIELKTSDITHIYTVGPDEHLMDVAYGPDGKHYYSRGYRKKDYSQIVALDLNTGEERELYRFPKFAMRVRTVISPDGRQLAFLNNDQNADRILRIIPSAGGPAKEVCNVGKADPGAPSQSLAWTADGRYILFSQYDRADFTIKELWRVPAEGGKPEKMGLQKKWGIFSITVHPDGRQIAFASKLTADTATEVWVMENFLPAE